MLRFKVGGGFRLSLRQALSQNFAESKLARTGAKTSVTFQYKTHWKFFDRDMKKISNLSSFFLRRVNFKLEQPSDHQNTLKIMLK